MPPQVQDVVLQRGAGGIAGPSAAAGPAVPIDAVEALALGTRQPALDRGQADTEAACGLALREPLADRLNQAAAQSFASVFWP